MQKRKLYKKLCKHFVLKIYLSFMEVLKQNSNSEKSIKKIALNFCAGFNFLCAGVPICTVGWCACSACCDTELSRCARALSPPPLPLSPPLSLSPLVLFLPLSHTAWRPVYKILTYMYTVWYI